MINLELLGGISFTKGCYPGQEIVARSQYLGKFKRRMILCSTNSKKAFPGMPVFSDLDSEQPCGMVVNSEKGPENNFDCLIEIKISFIKANLFLENIKGSKLVLKNLPYSLEKNF